MGNLIFVVAALLIQGAVPQQPRTASIEGSVVGPSGEALSKVRVNLTGPLVSARSITESANAIVTEIPANLPTRSGVFPSFATTDAGGKFIIDNLLPGSYLVDATRVGYVPMEYGQKGPNGRASPITLAPGQKLKDIQFVLSPDGVITGRIVDRNGEPMSRVRIQALRFTYQEQGRSLTLIQSVSTNDMGEYRLFWLEPGPYIISAMPIDTPLGAIPTPGPPPFNNSTDDATLLRINSLVMLGRTPGNLVTSRASPDGSTEEVAFVTTYYPGTIASLEATPVMVRAGSTVSGINMTVGPVRAQRIRGVTIDGTTGQREPMTISLIPKNGLSSPTIIADMHSTNDGTFDIAGVVPGSYFISASDGALRGMVPIEVGKSDVNNVTVTATVGFTLNGQIRGEGIVPDRRARSTMTAIRLLSMSAQSTSMTAPVTNGAFTLQGILPGDYQVSILGNEDRFVKSMRLGNQDVLVDGLRIQSQPEGQLDIVLSTATGRLEGRVVNERREPAANVTTVVVPDPPLRQRTSLYFTPVLDSSGKFQIDVMPGRYKVFAWEDVEPRAWFDADFMRTVESRGRSITIGEGGSETVDVTVIPYIP